MRHRRSASLPMLARCAAVVVLLAASLTARGAQAAGGVLHVLSSTPAAGAVDVPASGFISITFDRPVVTLADVGVAGAHPAAAISPSASGKGRWINTNIWAYQLPAGLRLDTRYTVTTRPDLAAQDGGRLSSPYSFSFETLRPGVLTVTPTSGTQYALPTDKVQVIFNQPVHHGSAQAAFELLAGGQSVPGIFTWNDTLIATQANGSGAVVPPPASGSGAPATPPPARDTVMTFHPAHPLPLGASVQATLGAGVLGTQGPLPMANPFSWRYQVTGPLRVLSATPPDGTTAANLQGGIAITLTAPATQAAVQKAVHISPKPDYQYVYLDDKGTTVTINGNFLPSTSYTITIDARALGTAHQALAAPYVLKLTTQPAQPSIQFVSQGQAAVYNAYLGANVYARVVNLPRVAVSLYRLSGAQFLRYLTNPPNNWSGQPPAGAPLLASWYLSAAAPQNRSILVKQPLQVNGRGVGPGYYLVDAGPGGGGGISGDHLLLVITRTSVTLKIGQRQAFVWATDLKSGKPVAGESVKVFDSSGRLWTSGSTNARGVFQATVAGLKSDDSLLQHTIQAQLAHGDDIAACGLDWNNGVGPWDYNLPFSSYLSPVRLYLTTERPIYRPGQPVYFKGIARRDNDGRYSTVAAGMPVQVQVQDARQSTILNVRLRIDRFGAFSGVLHLSPGSSLGSYTIGAGIGVSTVSSYFQVAAYKKPSYQVTVISDRGANANYGQGDRIGVQVRAAYYFGAPLGHAPVKWDLTQSDFTFTSSAFPDYDFVDQDYAAVQQQAFFGQQTTEGTGATDSRGDFHFAVPADVKKNTLSQQFTLEAIVTGPDNSQVSERTQVVVHKAALYVGLRPADYVGVAGKPNTVRLVTVADDGIHTVGGVPVTLKVYKRVWLSSFVRDANGFYYWQDKHRDTLVATAIVHSAANGQARYAFVPKDGGEYRIVAAAADAAGRQATSATGLWVVSASEAYVPWQTQNNDRIRLVADKKTYRPGDTAHILVTAPLAGMNALVTVERGSVLTYNLITLPTNSSQISVPILGYFAPDVFVSVTLVKGPGADTSLPVWKMGYITLPVDTSGQSLHVSVTASPAKAQPGQQVRYTIHATDAAGHGVQAQLAVALIDKAVLALAAGSATGLMDTFYQKRDLGVESAGSLTLYIDRLNLNQKVGSKGGSGGGGGGNGPTRKQFPDTAYWNPSLVTDANGNASVTVTLPDNLTTWTFTAIGGTASTLVGQTSMDLISSKDLLLVPALPRFLTVGDQAMGGAVVDNLTTAPQRVRVTLHSSGAGAPASYSSSVTVPAGGSQLVQWNLRAGGVGTQTFLFTAQAEGNPVLGDRLQVSLPVQTNAIPTVSAASGLFRTATTQTVPIPAGAQAAQSSLTITLAPSLISGLGDAASYLAGYPYDCAEQTTSRYYGLVQTMRLPAGVSGVSAAVASGVPAIVQVALGRLYGTQNGDGGWGWWPEDPSNPYVTAWAFDGLLTLKAAGYSVDAGVLKQAAGYLRNWALNPASPSGSYSFTYLPDATPTLDLKAYVAYLLGQSGSPDSGLVSTLYGKRQNMLPFARAYLAVAIARAAGTRDLRIHNLLAEIDAAAQQVAGQAHWRDNAPDWLMMENATSATAVILDALVRLDPSNPLILGSVRWLLAQRVDGAWDSTQSTALALRALVDYALRTQPLTGTSRFSVQLNGTTIGSGTVSDADRGKAHTFTVPLTALAGATAAKVTLQQVGGSGQMAYTITLRTVAPVTTSPAVEHGIVIGRQYQPVEGSHGQAGSDLRVVLTITAPQDLYYLVVEDPLPAGAEPVDPSLRTTSVLSGITSQTTIPRGTTDLGWYVSHVELRDDRAALFADYLPAGTYQYSYQIHLTSPGTYHALPTQAHLFYFPDTYGRGAGRLYTIQPQ